MALRWTDGTMCVCRWGPIAELSTVLWPSYGRRGDRINLGLLRITRGGGGGKASCSCSAWETRGTILGSAASSHSLSLRAGHSLRPPSRQPLPLMGSIAYGHMSSLRFSLCRMLIYISLLL